MGLDCRPDLALVGAEGEVSQRLYTIGAPAKGVFWETTAVPELRVQAQLLARKLTVDSKVMY
jgi:uncharacterized NAD(P)/FAD-binding protein YdhS